MRFKSILVWTIQCRGCDSEHDLIDLGTFDPELPPARPILEPSIFLCCGLAFEVTAQNTYLKKRDIPGWDMPGECAGRHAGEFRETTLPINPVHNYVDFSFNFRREEVTLRH